jgi:hypothetical protein
MPASRIDGELMSTIMGKLLGMDGSVLKIESPPEALHAR